MRSRFFRKNQGIITVFVVLIMVPVVVITGLMVDISRAKLFAAQVAMSSDFYGEAILSEYDNVLKELYGLFSVTQNEEGKEAIKTYASYMGYSFDPAKVRFVRIPLRGETERGAGRCLCGWGDGKGCKDGLHKGTALGRGHRCQAREKEFPQGRREIKKRRCRRKRRRIWIF